MDIRQKLVNSNECGLNKLPNSYKPVLEMNPKENELWRFLLGGQKTPAGKYAMITSSGIIMIGGYITNEGVYIRDHSLQYGTEHEIILKFKKLFIMDDYLNTYNFETSFQRIMNDRNVKRVWTSIHKLLHSRPEGKQFLLDHEFKIHSIVNMERLGYGISLNTPFKKQIGRSGCVYVTNHSKLVMVVNGKILKI